MSDYFDFLVSRSDFAETRISHEPPDSGLEPAPGQALLKVDLFSLTANNVTYAAMGEAMDYWKFFPAAEGWGRVPVWGYADVVASAADGLSEGQRIFGYLPTSSHLMVEPDDVSGSGFVDSSEHRAGLPAVYNRYGLATAETGDTPEREPYIALFAPLFTTSWLLEDWLEDEGFLGAERVLISSSSSKTALSLAFMLRQKHAGRIEQIALTSSSNVGFVESTGYYDSVVDYKDLESVDDSKPTAYIDFSGNAKLRFAVHERFSDKLVASTAVGAASWEDLVPEEGSGPLPGPQPELFFAPTRVAKRNEDWGAGELRRRISASQDEFVESSRNWLKIREATGADGLSSTWQEVLAGRVDPAEGWIVSL
jgi:hypothetical protein